MTQRRRVKLSANQRNDMWSRWKAGQSLHEIGRVFGKDHVSIQFMLAQHGGIAPAARRRSLLTLTLAEREDISRGIASGSSIREIAKGLERAASAVGREVARHGGRPLYRASDADQQAWESALRPKRCLLAIHGKLRDECLNGEIFYSMSEAQVVIEKWRVEYNTRRPHSALGYRPPAPASFAPRMAALRSPSAPYDPPFAPPLRTEVVLRGPGIFDPLLGLVSGRIYS